MRKVTSADARVSSGPPGGFRLRLTVTRKKLAGIAVTPQAPEFDRRDFEDRATTRCKGRAVVKAAVGGGTVKFPGGRLN